MRESVLEKVPSLDQFEGSVNIESRLRERYVLLSGVTDWLHECLNRCVQGTGIENAFALAAFEVSRVFQDATWLSSENLPADASLLRTRH